MTTLTREDHRAVLSYYGIDHTKMGPKRMRKEAEDVLAGKLCRCIKKVDPGDEKKSIAVCRASILARKGFDIYGFSCKEKPALKIGKNGRKLRKTARATARRVSKKRTRRSRR